MEAGAIMTRSQEAGAEGQKMKSGEQEKGVCYEQHLTKTPVNTTYLTPVTEEVQEFCWSWTLRCPRKITHFVTKWRQEVVTRVTQR